MVLRRAERVAELIMEAADPDCGLVLARLGRNERALVRLDRVGESGGSFMGVSAIRPCLSEGEENWGWEGEGRSRTA